MAIYINLYFIMLMVYALHFVFATLQSVVSAGSDDPLPWMLCDAWWNTPNCRNTSRINASDALKTVESTQEYWE